MKKSSRILAFVLTLLMVVSLMPVSALADELAPASAAESLLLPGMVDIPAIEETEEPVATETPAPTEAPAETEQPEATEAPVLPELDVVLPEVGSAAEAAIDEAAETEEEAPVEDVEEAAEDGDSTLVDFAIFFSDVHGSTSDLTSVMSGIKSGVDSGVTASVVGFDGDTSLTIEKATAAVTSGLGYSTYTDVYSYASSHDKENSSDIGTYWDYSGEAYGEESGENYYVYVIRETDMQTASTTAPNAFTTWVNGLTDTSKPLFILSHRPLHVRRNDNANAANWYTAISAAAEKMDITFFWAHNHTGETDVDTDAYYVAKDGTETMDIYNGDSGVTPNFTYMNAGYINANGQNPARKGIATTVGIYADSMVFQDYNSSGAYSGTYAHNVKVAREFASSGTTTPTLSSISVVRNKLMYSLGEDLDITVYATYEGQAEPVEVFDYTTDFEPYTAGVQTVTVSYGGKSTTMEDVIVAAAIVHSDVSIDEYEGTASLSALEAGTAEICREWTCYLSNTQTLSLDWEITDNGDGTYTVSCIGPFSEMASEVTYEVNGDTLVLTSVDKTYADEGYETASKTYTINSDGTLTEAGKGVSYLSISKQTDAYTIGDELYAEILVTREDYSTEYVTLDDCTVTPSCSCGAETVDELMNTVATGTDNDYHQVTIGYGGKTVNLLFTVGDAVAHKFDTGVIVSVSDFVSASGTVVKRADTTDLTIPATIENPVAYDITPGDGYDLNPGNYAEITFPIPDGVTNPVVYCVDNESAEYFKDIDDVADTYTVRTPHFSTWIIGETTVIEVPENQTQTSSATTDSSTDKTVYVLVDEPEAGEEYLIVSNDYALVNNSGSATGVSVEDLGEITIDGTTYEGYIELDNANAVWTAASGWTFKNGSYYLYHSSNSGSVSLDTSSATWTHSSSDNRLSYSYTSSSSGSNRPGSGNSGSTTTQYLYYGSNGWSVSSNTSGGSSRTVYFYKEVTYKVDNSVTTSGTYSIEGKDISVVAAEGSTAKLTSNLIFTPAADNTAEVESPVDVSTTATYEIVTVDKDDNTVDGDPNDILVTDEDGNLVITDGKVSFTGKYGTALVKVSYESDFGTVTDYITIEATAPYYTIDLHYADLTEVEAGATFDETATYYIYNDTTNVYEKVEINAFEDGVTYYTEPLVVGDEITSTVALKGIEAGDKYPVWAVVKYYDGVLENGEDGKDLGSLGDALHWTVSDTSIATIDTATGVLTFTGDNYGTFTVTVSYEGADGKVITDTITISATESLYIVPGDGTNDFPEYPSEGAVRFDKTATAVGNFSETGIAKVELSMTGVNYNKGSEIDVVIMLDMTGSMSETAMTAAEESAIAFAEQIVKNEDGSYNNNRIAILAFNSSSSSPFTYWTLGKVSSDDEWASLCTAVRAASEDQISGGTPYDEALAKCQEILVAAKTDGTGNNRQQFCVFVSDGGPTSYQYITNYDAVKAGTATEYTTSSATATGGQNQSDSNFATIATYTHEYYSTLMKDDGVTMFSVLTGLSAADYPNCTTILQNIASSADDAYVVENGSDTTAITNAFTNIAQKIMKAATNVVVEDKIGSNYTVNFSIPGYGTDYAVTDALEGTTEFYIQVVEYTLDENNDRSGDPDVLENFTFNADGTLKSHTVDGVACESCTHVTFTGGVVTAIDGTYFDYKSDSTGEYLTWETAELTDTELALQYFAYLDSSSGVAAADQIPAGTYYTNEYATLTYTNYLENKVQQKFPVPQMTWNGAQVSYTFYLVNDAGQPVNRAGRVVPFAEAIYVTEVFTYHILWNDLEQSAGLEAKYLAQNLVPDVYDLYDDDATYNIHVYEDEDKSNLNNHFVIGGDVTDDYNTVTNFWSNASTTYVFNNKSDANKYYTYGTYIASDGSDSTTTKTYLCKGDGTVSGVQFSEATVTSENDLLNGVYYTLVDGIYTRTITYSAEATYYTLTAASYTAADGETQWKPGSGDSTTGGTVIGNYVYYVDENGAVYTIVEKTDGTEVHDGFDFSNTTVAFAVVWKPELRPDTVVIDYGLDVVVDVIATDSLAAGVVGVREDAPSGITINSGTYDAAEATSVDISLNSKKIGTATVESQDAVRFSLNKDNGMQMSAPVKFYYEAAVNYYKENVLQTDNMYSSVTVIPATTIYYEDSFVTFKNGTGGSTGTWSAETTQSGTQALDRPGPDKIGTVKGTRQDADNVYGYDSAYDNMATYSMGSARYVTVSAANNPSNDGAWPTAEFTFTGTGFDIISMTDNTTGTIFVDVYAGTDTTGDAAYNWVVDTYYGYARERSSENPWLKHTWTYYASGWHVSTEEVTEEGNDGVSVLPESPAVGETCVMYEANYIWTVVDSNDPNALYQVPVINGTGLNYGTYTVVITPMYAAFFDHAGDGSYNFYLDAIRIYDPANEGAAAVDSEEYPTVADVYNKDSELAPDYYELRDWVLKAEEVTIVTENLTTTLEGIAFIDTIFVDAANGTGAGEVQLVTDYNEVGPNNELYLTCGNAIAFNLDGSKDGYTVQSIQLGMKSVGGNAVVKVYDPTATKSADATAQTLSTATDMYYDITDLNGKIVVIENAGTEGENAILSITNIKITYVASTTTTADDFLSGYNLGAVALTGTSLIEEAEVAVVEEDEVILDGTAGDEATEESVFTVTAQTVEAAIKALGNATDETSAEDNTGSGEEETPGDEESGGDAGDDTTGDDTTGDDTTGDDTTEEDDDTTSAAVSLINKVNKILQSIRDILSSVLGWLAR